MQNIKIPTVVEKNYINSIWCNDILKGINSAKGNKIELISDADFEQDNKFGKNSGILIVGSSHSFIDSNVEMCLKKGLRPIVIGAEYNNINGMVSSVSIDRKRATAETVYFFYKLGMKRIALLGINSYSYIDAEKKIEFLNRIENLYNYNAENDIYYSDNSPDDCINLLLENISKYDSVICSNDYFAISLIIAAKKANINIPDDIMIIGYGNSYIGKKTTPSLSTVSPNYYEMGQQALKTYIHLLNNPEIISCNVCVNYKIISRESTKSLSLPTYNNTKITDNTLFQSTFSDTKVKKLLGLDQILSTTDATMEKIIYGIMNDTPYSKLAEELYLSDTAFMYKLKKLFTVTNTKSKKELSDLLNTIFK